MVYGASNPPTCEFQVQALAMASCRERFVKEENQARGLGLGGGTGSALFQSEESGVQVRAAAAKREEWEAGFREGLTKLRGASCFSGESSQTIRGGAGIRNKGETKAKAGFHKQVPGDRRCRVLPYEGQGRRASVLRD